MVIIESLLVWSLQQLSLNIEQELLFLFHLKSRNLLKINMKPIHIKCNESFLYDRDLLHKRVKFILLFNEFCSAAMMHDAKILYDTYYHRHIKQIITFPDIRILWIIFQKFWRVPSVSTSKLVLVIFGGKLLKKK